MFEVGDCVQIATEWRDAGDDVTIYWVKAVNGDRYIIEPLGTGMAIPPVFCTVADMIEKLTPDHMERCLSYAREHGQEGAL